MTCPECKSDTKVMFTDKTRDNSKMRVLVCLNEKCEVNSFRTIEKVTKIFKGEL